MKLWITTSTMSNYTNFNRIIPSYTLHIRHLHCLFFSRSHLSRRKLRMTNPKSTCKWSIILLYLLIHAYCPRTILRLISLQRNMKCRSSTFPTSYNNSICRLRLTMRTDIILRSHSNYQPTLRRPICRKCFSTMNLRRLFS